MLINGGVVDQVLEHLPFAACRLDGQFNLQYSNSFLPSLVGRTGASIMGQPLSNVIPSRVFCDIRLQLEQTRNGMSATLRAQAFEEFCCSAILEISVLPNYTNSGHIDGALVFMRDVTQGIRLAETQKELVDHLDALDAHAIVAVTDINGVITEVNDKFCDISQYTREQLIGKTHRVVKSGIHPNEFYDELWRTISSGKVWQGDICNRARDGSHYWVHSTIVPFVGADGLPSKYIAIRADITKLKQVEQQASQLAMYDPLTNLPNRRLLRDRLEQAALASARSGQYCALIFADLDDFKRINDANGHLHGDSILCEVAERLTLCVRSNDTVARLGGDEYMSILCDLGSNYGEAISAVSGISGTIQRALNAPYHLNVQNSDMVAEVITTASLGVVLFTGSNTVSADLLLQADIAMHCAKSNGKNQVIFFEPSQQKQANERFLLEAELRNAIERQELCLYYQPITDASARIIGMEALIRWQHPVRGLVSPLDFIPIAEQSGLIIPIGDWVLQAACAQLVEWQKHPETSNWTLAVNVSARQFNSPDFVQKTLSLLNASTAKAERLCIELTETVLLNSSDRELLDKIHTLRSRQVQFALDDFGTGYSSLNYLRNLPLDRLKIDRSFVQTILDNPNDQIITAAILSIADSMKLKVIVEGVETQAQFDYLRGIGCSAFQGYLLGRPNPIAHSITWPAKSDHSH